MYPIIATVKGKDPFENHPFPRWRFAEHQLLCAIGASVSGLVLYGIFHKYVPQEAAQMMLGIVLSSFAVAATSWIWTRGTFALVPNPVELPAYVRNRVGFKKHGDELPIVKDNGSNK